MLTTLLTAKAILEARGYRCEIFDARVCSGMIVPARPFDDAQFLVALSPNMRIDVGKMNGTLVAVFGFSMWLQMGSEYPMNHISELQDVGSTHDVNQS